MHRPILSICIPTYNRELYLRGLLEAIVSQDEFSDQIEVFIYDDPSSDNTQAMVEGFMEKYPNIRYHRNTIRAGMTPSILDSILQCTGEYIWLFGSDDIVGSGGLKAMLQMIREQSPDMILSNYAYVHEKRDHDATQLVYQTFDSVSSFCNSMKNGDKTHKHHYISYFSYMSIFCFKNSIFQDSYRIVAEVYGIEHLKDHYFNYILILFGGNLLHHICLCTNPVLVYNQSGAVSWRMNIKIIHDTFSVLHTICKQYSLTRSTYMIFIKIYFTWWRWLVENRIYHSSVFRYLRTKQSVLYTKLIQFYHFLRD